MSLERDSLPFTTLVMHFQRLIVERNIRENKKRCSVIKLHKICLLSVFSITFRFFILLSFLHPPHTPEKGGLRGITVSRLGSDSAHSFYHLCLKHVPLGEGSVVFSGIYIHSTTRYLEDRDRLDRCVVTNRTPFELNLIPLIYRQLCSKQTITIKCSEFPAKRTDSFQDTTFF